MPRSHLISIKMIDKETKKEEVLYKRPHSRCHFKEWFAYETYKIQLRLDWDDIANGEPMLDADIIDLTSGNRVRNGNWHHTSVTIDPNSKMKTYVFRFQNLEMELSVIKTMGIGYGLDTVIAKGP
jgi:hypothetical protein